MTNNYNWFKKIEVICNKNKKLTAGYLENKNGVKMFTTADKLKIWEEYTTELYREEDRDLNTSFNCEEGPPIMREEVEKAIQNTATKKAPGPDTISIEMIKLLEDKGIDLVHKLANKIYESGEIPQELLKSTLIPIPKNQKASRCDQYRTISLMSHTLKIILKIILDRIKSKVRTEISETQTGFLPGKGTINALFMVRTIIERSLEVNKELYVCFLDYSKAFDNVNHVKLFDILQQLNIDDRDLRLIKNLYKLQTSTIRIDNCISENIEIRKGVRQGCILSPDLFNIYSEQIFKQIEELRGIFIGGKIYNTVRYADDALLIAENENDLIQLIKQVENISKDWGLQINNKKTVFMVISKKTEEL